jgi:Zn-dependent protease with chaperone function
MYSHDIPFRFTLASLWFDSVLEWISFSKITWNYLSQEKEKNADEWWIQLINSLELNLNCSTWFFEWDNIINPIFTTLLSTHPSSESRIENIKNNAEYKTECTPLKYYNI